MNELVFFGELIFFLIAMLLTYKFFGKIGLYAFTVFAVLLSNVQVLMYINVFGVAATGGNALYASNSLVTDILSEKYGKKFAKTAVKLGFFAMVLWLSGTQLTMLYKPNTFDFISPALREVLSLAPRITIASLAAYLCAQLLDVQIYNYIWQKTGKTKKMLWLRNNGSTLTTQLVDTLVFTTIAFYGTVDAPTFISMMLTTYLFKAIVTISHTPFMYLSRRINPINELNGIEKA